MTKVERQLHSVDHGNLEKVVLDGSRPKRDSVLGQMFANKTRTLKSTVNALIGEINLRQSLNTELINRIGSEILGRNKVLELLDKSSLHYTLEGSARKKELEEQIEKDLLELRREERKEISNVGGIRCC